MKLKPGVKLTDLSPQIVLAALVIHSIFSELAAQCTITSVNDSTHSANSFHYKGQAIDIRTKDYNGDKGLLRDSIKAALGQDFDVILEDSDGVNEHIHVEWDPK